MSAPVRRMDRARSAHRAAALLRIGVVAAVLALLLAADGFYMRSTGYGSGSTYNFGLSDAGTIFVAAAIVGAIAVLLLTAWGRESRRTR